MYRKMMFRYVVLLTILAVTAGCATEPATANQGPVVAEDAQRPAEPTSTAIPPTEQSIEASATASVPTSTPVVTEIVATSTDQFAGSWKWFIRGTPTTLTFHKDGTWVVVRADAAPGTNSADGEFSFDGTVFTVTGDPDCPSVVGRYEAPRIEQYDGVNHKLSFKVIEDECEDRVKDFRKGFIWSNGSSQ